MYEKECISSVEEFVKENNFKKRGLTTTEARNNLAKYGKNMMKHITQKLLMITMKHIKKYKIIFIQKQSEMTNLKLIYIVNMELPYTLIPIIRFKIQIYHLI